MTAVSGGRHDSKKMKKRSHVSYGGGSSSAGLQPLSRPISIGGVVAEATINSLSEDTDSMIPSPSLNDEKDRKHDAVNDVKPSYLTNEDEDSDRALLPSMTIGSNYSASQLQSDARVIDLNIATPTENVAGEVEVQVKLPTGASKSRTKSQRTATSMFPATHPKSSGSNLIIPLPSSGDDISLASSMSFSRAISLRSKPKSPANESCSGSDSGLYLSDIDTITSSAFDGTESTGAWSPLYEASLQRPSSRAQHRYEDDDATSTIDEVNITESVSTSTNDDAVGLELSTPPRRSSRLSQLREWQEKKKQSEEAERRKELAKTSDSPEKISKKRKTIKSKKSSKASTERVTKSTSTSVDKKNIKPNATSSEREMNKSNSKSSDRGRLASKTTTASVDKRVKKKTPTSSPEKVRVRVAKKSTTTTSSPDKASRSKNRNGEVPLQDHTRVEESSSPDPSPQKAGRNKPKKVPNSRRKKSGMFSGVLGRS